MTDLESLSNRLTALESRHRRSRRLLVIGCLAITVGAVMAQGPRRYDPPNTRALEPESVIEAQVRAHQFILVDGSGKDRASLVADGAGSVFLVLFDTNGRARADLSVGNYGPSLTFYDPSGQARSVLGSTMLVSSHVTENGIVERTPASSLVLFDRTGKVLWRTP